MSKQRNAKSRPKTKPDPSAPRDPGDQVEIWDLVLLHAATLPNGRIYGTVLDVERGDGVVLYRVRSASNPDQLLRVRREEIYRAWPIGGPDGATVRALLPAWEKAAWEKEGDTA